MKTVEFISAEIGEGAQQMGCKFGPARLRAMGLVTRLRAAGQPAQWGPTVTAHDELLAQGKLAVVQGFTPELADASHAAAAAGRFPVVLGGDHSCAIGTWSGIAQALQPQGALGLIWIDAHLDSHTPATSESGAPHGMPLAALLGHGDAQLTDAFGWRGKLAPEHVVVIGARSYEPGEQALLQQLGVRVMYMPEVAQRGMAACMAEAMERVSRGTAGWGVTLDLDAIDPADAPGVGSPETDGIPAADVLAALRGLADQPGCAGFELVELNPALDDAEFTSARLCRSLVEAVVLPGAVAHAAPLARAA
ncbi:MAG TPA: arginase [Burkholderiaceae bacterium]|nr:arginase [Burkholderiaceae bacterium]